MSRVLADLVLLVHLAFVVFVAAGVLAVWRWPRLVWLHVPAAIWGALVEICGWVCPLTPLEDSLRRRSGDGVPGGFVDRYVTAILYPDGLTRRQQLALGALVIALNVSAYTVILARRRRPLPRRRASS